MTAHPFLLFLIFVMSLSHALLTSLLEQPSTGIELARRFDRSMGYFWHATHQQIYRELSAMFNKGWISTLEHEDYTGRKKTYQVEQLGRTELADWMLKQSPPAQLREELMVRLRAEAQLGSDLILPELARHLALHRVNLQVYQQIFAKDFSSSMDDALPLAQQHILEQNRTLFIHKMILQLGIDLEQGWIEWLERLISGLKVFQQQA
ncbi:DNA-binding PadR family transcriptional regulator [Acinetobacter calcoaceticus]|uniref:DNA-binding PadR family transcriptional regulator n=1 Tax=Acinetobacter calcoaceticus TaxID=471 RepID=A0A4R1XKD6_ACICA|nr:DNA-binding PadR family transcriptional regulator [Acinetobacter calcoaceticus]